MQSKPHRPRLGSGAVLLALIGCVDASRAETLKPPVVAHGRVVRLGNVASIGTAASGIVADLKVQKGVHVEKGQLLVRIECADIEKELDARKAELGALEAALARVEHGPRAEDLAVAAANVESATARMEQTVADLKRIEPDGATTSEAQLERARLNVKEATAQLDEARAKQALLRSGSRSEDISEARFSRDAARATVEEVSARLDRCSVRAPFAGTVLGTKVTLGQFVSAAAPQPLLDLIDTDRLGVRADVDERDVARICPKQNAVATADSIPAAQVDVVTEDVSETPAASREREAREVTLAPVAGSLNWPVGLPVTVRFKACPAE